MNNSFVKVLYKKQTYGVLIHITDNFLKIILHIFCFIYEVLEGNCWW